MSTVKMTRRTRRWIRRHTRRHGQVIIAKQTSHRSLSGTLDQDAVVVVDVTAYAKCPCGESVPAYEETILGFDGSRAVA